MSKIGLQQSTLHYDVILYENKQNNKQRKTKCHIDKTHKGKRETRIHC